MRVLSCKICGIVVDFEKVIIYEPDKLTPWSTYFTCPCCKTEQCAGTPISLAHEKESDE